jgi:PAN domain
MPALLYAALMTLLSLPAHAVDGFNLPGSDYDNFSAGSAMLCTLTCAGDPRCKARTWVKPGIQEPSGHCRLKDRVPTLVRDSYCHSRSAENIQSTRLRAENNIHRPASDYRHFSSANYQLCQKACAQEQPCSSWTWVRPGVQEPNCHCWLKTSAPHPVADNNCISGVKLWPRSVPIDP